MIYNTNGSNQPLARFSRRVLKGGIAAAVCLLAFPQFAEAKNPKFPKLKHGKSESHGNKHDDHDDRDRQAYISRPRSTFVLSLGTGYAGRGYYYGPPNAPYYYQRSDVSYYATREAAPREYYSTQGYGNSTDVAVQRALSRRGYYRGPIDGAIGPMSHRSIARYQRDNGLSATGYINSSLLRSLGL